MQIIILVTYFQSIILPFYSILGRRVPPHLQVLLVIDAMAGGSHQVEIGDCYDVSEQFVSVVLARVARAIAGLRQNYRISRY